MVVREMSKEKGKAVVELNVNEMIILCNSMCNKNKTSEDENKLYGDLMLALSMCKYGRADDFCIDFVKDCRKKIEDVNVNKDVDKTDNEDRDVDIIENWIMN